MKAGPSLEWYFHFLGGREGGDRYWNETVVLPPGGDIDTISSGKM